VRGLHKTFGQQHVLRGVDLDLERGKINIVIGGSGQGKSVFMKHLMGLLQPDQGRIYVDGRGHRRHGRVELRSCGASSAWSSSTRRCSTP
jgi:ABC-type transporter Mla maintaining outer membrane lipid asymmetry ATPase subunit MlaF